MSEDATNDTTEQEAPAPDTTADKGEPNPLLNELKQERRQRKALESRLTELERAAEEARQAALPEQERLVEQARKEARDQALAEVRTTLAAAKVHAAAATLGFVDPNDAAAHIDLAGLDPDKDDAVAAAVRALAEAKPYLVGRPNLPAAPKVPGGPQATEKPSGTFNEFLLGAVRGKQG